MNQIQTRTEQEDLKDTRNVVLIVASVLAWLSEGLLLFSLWSARYAPAGASLSRLLIPLFHLLPWFAGMKWLWNVRRAVRSGALDAAGAEKCHEIISDFMLAAYMALTFVENVVAAWKA